MLYDSNKDLPDSVRNVLPSHAQDIYLSAFNNAWEEYKSPYDRHGDDSGEEVSHKVAWAAVKKKYYKVQDRWEEKAKIT